MGDFTEVRPYDTQPQLIADNDIESGVKRFFYKQEQKMSRVREKRQKMSNPKS